MNRKELIEWLEKLRSEAVERTLKLMLTSDNSSITRQLGKAAAFRTVIAKLKEREESEADE